ncbi:hypothetical protein H5410_029624 [Solanum commersonii]|uniref:Uncharacterized protein n=1 Tax=Solanum commersonii TaxID=4109 RepID=A0A9J5YGX0_SOLCO|nr:hypothetical protein H5410_029624 [Solanum commersonii]
MFCVNKPITSQQNPDTSVLSQRISLDKDSSFSDDKSFSDHGWDVSGKHDILVYGDYGSTREASLCKYLLRGVCNCCPDCSFCHSIPAKRPIMRKGSVRTPIAQAPEKIFAWRSPLVEPSLPVKKKVEEDTKVEKIVNFGRR